MPVENIKTLYTFSVLTDKLVDEVTTKVENAGTPEERIVSETVKVNKPVPIHFAFKKPSRAERENAEEERASWWSKYVERGILPEALLLKTYANLGGILSEEQKKDYTEDRVQLSIKIEELMIEKAMKEPNKEYISQLTTEMINLRDKIIRFEQEQSTFFENTAEAKSRVKLSEYLVLHQSYTRDSEESPWVPYFKGNKTIEKLAEMERLEDSDEIYRQAGPQLFFLASFLINSNYSATKDDIDEFLKQNSNNG